MSDTSRKRKASESGRLDKCTTTDFFTSSNVRSKHTRLPESLTPSSKPIAKTKLNFEFGASLEFKVVYATTILIQDEFAYIDVKAANIHEASIILFQARKYATEQLVPEAFISVLHDMIEKVKNETGIEQDIRCHLEKLRSGPELDLNDVVLEDWLREALDFVNHAAAFSDKFDINNDLLSTREAILRIYGESIQIVQDQSLIVETTSEISDTMELDHAVGPSKLHQYLSEMYPAKPPCAQSVRKRFLQVFYAYQSLYSLVLENESKRFKNFPLSEFASAFRTIRRELLNLLGCSDSKKSLRDQFLDRTEREEILCQGLSHALASRLSTPLRNLLANRLDQLRILSKDQPSIQLDHEFTTLASLISDFSFATPMGVTEENWTKHVPRTFTQTQAQCFMNKLQCIHAAMQVDAYAKDEMPRLWLNIWKGLKSIYLLINEHNLRPEGRGFPLEARFFYRRTIQNQFELILSSPEASSPDIIENVVGEYCIFIAECQQSQSSEYDMLRKLKASPIKEPIFKIVEHFTQTREWNDLAIRGIEKCAIRLNHLTGGPAFIRRQIRKPTSKQRELQKWTFDKCQIGSERGPSKPSSVKSVTQPAPSTRINSLSSISTSNPAGLTSHTFAIPPALVARASGQHNATQISPQSLDHWNRSASNPQSIDVVSAFDYVVYPFPETRAIEVAQSRQISREMSQPGIYSDGTLPEDVINLPPRHTWPPGVISPWAKPLPIDPISVIRDIWSSRHRDRSLKSKLKEPRSLPALTPRRSRKERADRHPPLRPLPDMKRRVAKPTAVERQTQFRSTSPKSSRCLYVPKLRGGGSPEPGNDQSQNPATPPNSAQLSTSEMSAVTTELVNRMQGFWGNRPMPSIAHIREFFLIPNNWKVDAAHEAARRFVNHGLADFGTPTDDNTRSHDAQESNANFVQPSQARVTDDPYYTPTTGLDPTVYGMPMGQGPILPPGRRGPRFPPTSPTPLSRRGGAVSSQGLSLDQPLPAHWLSPNNGELPPNATAGQNAFTNSGLPDPFQIFKDPSSNNNKNPSPSSSSSIPAPNQDHQARRDRRRRVLTSLNPDDTHSHNENNPPHSSPVSNPVQLTIEGGCNGNVCHPCPQYSGLFHHVCLSQATSTNIQNPTRPRSSSDEMRYGPTSPDYSPLSDQPETNTNKAIFPPGNASNQPAASTFSTNADDHNLSRTNTNGGTGLDNVEQTIASVLRDLRNKTLKTPVNQLLSFQSDASQVPDSIPSSTSTANPKPRPANQTKRTKTPPTTSQHTQPKQTARRASTRRLYLRVTNRTASDPPTTNANPGIRGGRITRSMTAAARAAGTGSDNTQSRDPGPSSTAPADLQGPATRGRPRGRPPLNSRANTGRGRGAG